MVSGLIILIYSHFLIPNIKLLVIERFSMVLSLNGTNSL